MSSVSGSNRRSTDASAMLTKAPPTFEQCWSVWASGFGGSQNTSGNAAVGSNNTTSQEFGTAVGADYWVSADRLAGFALAGGGTNLSVPDGGTDGSDLFEGGGFGADHGLDRNEMEERLLGRRHIRGRVFQRDLKLRWQRRGAVRLMSGGTPPPPPFHQLPHHAAFLSFPHSTEF
jgi:hypothetical protein